MQHKIILLACIAVIAGALALQASSADVYLFGHKLPLRCALYEMFGVKCALCGATRSLCTLAHGDFSQSIRFHLLGPAIFTFICLQIPYRIYRLIVETKGVNRRLTKLNAGLTVSLVTAIFVNWFIYLGGLIL